MMSQSESKLECKHGRAITDIHCTDGNEIARTFVYLFIYFVYCMHGMVYAWAEPTKGRL